MQLELFSEKGYCVDTLKTKQTPKEASKQNESNTTELHRFLFRKVLVHDGQSRFSDRVLPMFHTLAFSLNPVTQAYRVRASTTSLAVAALEPVNSLLVRGAVP